MAAPNDLGNLPQALPAGTFNVEAFAHNMLTRFSRMLEDVEMNVRLMVLEWATNFERAIHEFYESMHRHNDEIDSLRRRVNDLERGGRYRRRPRQGNRCTHSEGWGNSAGESGWEDTWEPVPWTQ